MAAFPNRCAADPVETAEPYAMGQLPDPEFAAFEEHLLICAACRPRVEQADGYVQAMIAAARRLGSKGQ